METDDYCETTSNNQIALNFTYVKRKICSGYFLTIR